MKKIKLSVVIPSFNERENIERSITITRECLRKHKISFEIIIVDDLSPDGTGAIVKRLARKWPEVHLIENPVKKGIGFALAKGYTAAKGEVICSTDADCSVDPEFIVNGLNKIERDGLDVVVGCRHCKEGYYEAKEAWYNYIRIPVSKTGNMFTRAVTGIPVNDFSLNFRLFKKRYWREESIKNYGNAFMLEVIVEAAAMGAKVGQIPVKFMERKAGATKTRLGKETLKFFKRLLELKFVEKKP